MANKKVKLVLLHISAWLMLYGINYAYVNSNGLQLRHWNQVMLFIIYAAVFYTHYFLVFPFLFKKKILLAILFSISIIALSFVAKQQLQQKVYEQRLSERQRNMPRRARGNRAARFQQQQKVGTVLQNRKNIVADIITLSFFVFFSLLLRFYFRWQHEEKQKLILQKEKTDAELAYLREQINPHFLFNSLNSIYSQAISKSDDIADTVLKLSSILRYVLYDTQKELVFLKDELKSLEDYNELQKLRLTDNVTLVFNVIGNPSQNKIEPLLLMPLLENAFKYGVDNINASLIDIQIKIEGEKLKLAIANTKAQVYKEEGSYGIGNKNIQRRLSLLYPNMHSFLINETEKEYKVYLELKLKQ